jgi:hypothetical protein
MSSNDRSDGSDDTNPQKTTPSEQLSKPSTNSESSMSAREKALLLLTGESSIEEAEAQALNLG